MRIAVGGFLHESTTFVAQPTTWDDAIARAVWGLGFVLATVSVTLPVIDYVVDHAAGRAPGAKKDASRARRHLARRPRKNR